MHHCKSDVREECRRGAVLLPQMLPGHLDDPQPKAS